MPCHRLLLVLCLMAASWAAPLPVLLSERQDGAGRTLPVSNSRRELIAMLASEAGQPLEAHAYPWRRAQRLAERGDGLLWGVVETPQRSARFDFSVPLYASYVWMVVRADRQFSYRSVQDLRGKTVSIMRGSQYGGDFSAQRDKLFRVEEEAGSLEARLAMLARGRTDLLLLSSTRESASEQQRYLNLRYGQIGRWAVLAQPFSIDPIRIAAARGQPPAASLPQLNRAIARLQQQGAVQAVLRRQNASQLQAASQAAGAGSSP